MSGGRAPVLNRADAVKRRVVARDLQALCLLRDELREAPMPGDVAMQDRALLDAYAGGAAGLPLGLGRICSSATAPCSIAARR